MSTTASPAMQKPCYLCRAMPGEPCKDEDGSSREWAHYHRIDPKALHSCKDCGVIICGRRGLRAHFCDQCAAKRRTAAARESNRCYQKRLRARRKQLSPVRVAVARALRMGDLVRPGKCSRCEKIGRVDGHHSDYSKPLEVVWLCSSCHRKQHLRKDAA
jgi:hypothetical protein